MDVKELTTILIKEEFGDLLFDLRYWGPHEEEDIDVDVILKEEPADLVDRSYRIRRRLISEGFDVLIDYRPMNLHGQKITTSSPVNISQPYRIIALAHQK